MKILIFSILSLAFTSSASVMAEDIPIEFRGITRIGASHLFSLSTNNETKQSAWVSVGDRFAGYAIVAFDLERNILILQRNGREFRLSLFNATSRSAIAEAEEATELARLIRELPLEAQGEQFLVARTKGMDQFVDAVESAATLEAMLEVLSHHLWETALWKEVADWVLSGLTEEELATLNDPQRNVSISMRLQYSIDPYFKTLQQLKYDAPYAESEVLQSSIRKLEALEGNIPPRPEDEL